MGDFQLYGSVLTADQINALYLAGATTLGPLPTTSPVQVASGATLDLDGISQQVASLSNVNPGDTGTVQNSNALTACTLTLAQPAVRTTSAAILPAAAAWARSTSS